MPYFVSKETKIKNLKNAEANLIEFAKKFGDRDPDSYEIFTEDTPISYNTLPLKKKKREKESKLYMHAVIVRAKDVPTSTQNEGKASGLLSSIKQTLNGSKDSKTGELSSRKCPVPLVLLHGYMNGAMYFYRNLIGLTSYFETVYALDILGCGLSSRRSKLVTSDSLDRSVKGTELLFAESIEAWRKAKGIPKIILAGHSLGGYIGVAYCDKYPDPVQQLVLLSPAGVTHPDMKEIEKWWATVPWREKLNLSFGKFIFEIGLTPGIVFRAVTTAKGKNMVDSYIKRRMPEIDPEEQQAISDYLYYNGIISGSGEYMLNRFLTPYSNARVPTVDRIPLLKVPHISFLYGESDWMERDGGVEVKQKTERLQQENGKKVKTIVDVYEVPDAGHLFMLENWKGFQGGLVSICGGEDTLSPDFPRPTERLELSGEPSLYVANYKSDIKHGKKRSYENSKASSEVASA